MNFTPNIRQANTNSGTFKTTPTRPTGQPVKWLTICAMPVTPPATMELGKVIKEKPIPLMAVPRRMISAERASSRVIVSFFMPRPPYIAAAVRAG